MVYAYPLDRSINAAKRVPMSTKLSPEAKTRREFIRSHDFYLAQDSDGNNKIMAIAKEINAKD